MTVAWGLPYFERHVAQQAKLHLPFDHRAGKSVLLPTRRFPSDPHDTILEENDVAILMQSDGLAHIDNARKSPLRQPAVLRADEHPRHGVRRRQTTAGQAEPAEEAGDGDGIPGAVSIPETWSYIGFTSTQKAGLGPRLIANHETLGFIDLRGGYFHGGTHMHLSRLNEDLEAWYLNFDFDERVLTTFRPGLTTVKQGTQTVPQGPKDVATQAQTAAAFAETGRSATAPSIQTTSRLLQDVVGPDGTRYPKGTAIPQRADFNTLDNPFAWSTAPGRRQAGETPTAGVHFVVFNPSSDDLRAQPARHGRCAAGRHEARGRSGQPRTGLQLGAHDDAPPELPRAASRGIARSRSRSCTAVGRHEQRQRERDRRH